MAPYEALYGRKCRTPLFWTELGESKIFGVDLIRDAEQKVKVIRESLKVSTDRSMNLQIHELSATPSCMNVPNACAPLNAIH